MKTNIKMRVTPEQSKRVQEICFKNNIAWHGVKAFNHLRQPYIYVYGNTLGYDCKESSEYFNDHENIEIDADLFIRTNGTCEENSNYKSGDFLKCIIFYDIGVRVRATYQIQEVDNYNSRITFLDDDLDTRSIEISRLNKYFKKVESKYTELSTSTDKPYSVPILEAKLKKKNEILKKARIKRKNQREELHKLNLKLQKCISFEQYNKIVDELKKDINFRNETIKNTLQISKDRLKEIEELNKQIDKINKDNVNHLSDNILLRDKEIEKLKAVIEYLESKVK